MEKDMIDKITDYRVRVSELNMNPSNNGHIIQSEDEIKTLTNQLLDILGDLNNNMIVSSIDKLYEYLGVALIKHR